MCFVAASNQLCENDVTRVIIRPKALSDYCVIGEELCCYWVHGAGCTHLELKGFVLFTIYLRNYGNVNHYLPT